MQVDVRAVGLNFADIFAMQVQSEKEFFIDTPLVRLHFIIEVIWWSGLAPWEFRFPLPGSLISTFLLWRVQHHW